MARRRLQRIAAVGIVLAVALILIVTLTPVALDGDDGCALGLPCAVGHVAVFALLGVPVALAFATSDAARRSPRRVLGMIVLAIWVFAAVDELAQGWVDGRDPDLVDWIADMVGAAVGLLLGSVLLRALVEGPSAVAGGAQRKATSGPPTAPAVGDGPRRRRAQRRRR